MALQQFMLEVLDEFAGPVDTLSGIWMKTARIDALKANQGGTDCIDALNTFSPGSPESAPNSLHSFFDPRRARTAASLSCGHNDRIHGKSTATVYGQMLDWVALAQARGYSTVILMTLMDSVNFNPADGQTWRAELNDMIRDGAAMYGYEVADQAADPVLGCVGCAANTAYFSDGVHPTAAGLAIQAEYIAGVLVAAGFE